MAENETIEHLRWSLAQKRLQADAHLQEVHEQGPLPSVDEVLESKPVRFVTEHPVIAGIAAGAIYLIGPARLLRIVGMSISVLQSARTLRAAQRMFMNQ
jgi:hypothetical protein